MSFRQLAHQFGEYAGFVPGMAVSLVVSLALCGAVGRALRISRVHGWALIMAFGVVLSATLTPSLDALETGAQGSGTCDLRSLGLTWWELTHLSDPSLNVLLFLPLGVAIGLCPRSPGKVVVLAIALILPMAIELTQLLIVSLDRECQSADVIPNMLGLVLGIAAGSLARRFAPSRPSGDEANL